MATKYTKKHYIDIAKVLKENSSREKILMALCELFQKDNQNFDMRKFCLASLKD